MKEAEARKPPLQKYILLVALLLCALGGNKVCSPFNPFRYDAEMERGDFSSCLVWYEQTKLDEEEQKI